MRACVNAAGQSSTSTVDLATASAIDSELREGMLGGTVEADMDDRGLEMPIFTMDSKTNESSCPSWLQKVNADLTPIILLRLLKRSLFILTKQSEQKVFDLQQLLQSCQAQTGLTCFFGH